MSIANLIIIALITWTAIGVTWVWLRLVEFGHQLGTSTRADSTQRTARTLRKALAEKDLSWNEAWHIIVTHLRIVDDDTTTDALLRDQLGCAYSWIEDNESHDSVRMHLLLAELDNIIYNHRFIVMFEKRDLEHERDMDRTSTKTAELLLFSGLVLGIAYLVRMD